MDVDAGDCGVEGIDSGAEDGCSDDEDKASDVESDELSDDFDGSNGDERESEEMRAAEEVGKEN